MRLKAYLDEKIDKHIVNQRMKKRINTQIQKLLKPTYFDKVPLQPLFDILETFNLVPLQEDNTYWDGFLFGGVKSLIDDKKRYPVITN